MSKHKPLEVDLKYYVGVRDKIPVYKSGDPNSSNRALLLIRFVKDEVKFSIITTHFTWSPKGTVIHLQRVNLNKMLRILDSIGEFVLCGDFNAPRGKEIYNKLVKLYTDNIPPEVTTTIDPNLHRAKKLQFVVDGMFSTPQFKLSKVQLIEGISDHKAIVGVVTRA